MSRDHNRKPAEGLIDTLANLVGEIVTDARQRVLEEGWFGRPVTRGSFDDMVRNFYGTSPVEPAAPERSPDMGYDR